MFLYTYYIHIIYIYYIIFSTSAIFLTAPFQINFVCSISFMNLFVLPICLAKKEKISVASHVERNIKYIAAVLYVHSKRNKFFILYFSLQGPNNKLTYVLQLLLLFFVIVVVVRGSKQIITVDLYCRLLFCWIVLLVCIYVWLCLTMNPLFNTGTVAQVRSIHKFY